MNKSNLDNVRIATPCNVPWESMTGDDLVRHCGKCRLSVYNISNMTRREAAKLVGLDEDICITLYRRSDGTTITQDCPVSLKELRKTLKLTLLLIVVIFTGSILVQSLYKQTMMQETEFNEGKKDLQFD